MLCFTTFVPSHTLFSFCLLTCRGSQLNTTEHRTCARDWQHRSGFRLRLLANQVKRVKRLYWRLSVNPDLSVPLWKRPPHLRGAFYQAGLLAMAPEWTLKFKETVRITKAVKKNYESLNKLGRLQTFEDYADLYQFFMTNYTNTTWTWLNRDTVWHGDEYGIPRLDLSWLRDDVFANQRLAGVNPKTIQRIASNTTGNGLSWEKLKSKLNQEVDFLTAFETALGGEKFKAVRV